MSRFIDIIGQKFGRLFVLQKDGKNKQGNYKWLCICDCGNAKTICSGDLKNGHTKSCGCLQKEIVTKHGHSQRGKKTKIYGVWQEMVQRCTNPRCKQYKDYGDRGITVCKRWMKFKNFLKDMGEVPKGLQIHREDNDGNYCKLNCRWATRKEQMRNRRNNHLITYNGKIQCSAAWAEEYCIPYDVLRQRINKLNWSIEKALTTPMKKYKKRKNNG